MDYKEIRSKVNADYAQVEHLFKKDEKGDTTVVLMSQGRRGAKTYYINHLKALDILHRAVSPFIPTKSQFVEYLTYQRDNIDPEVFDMIKNYCKATLDIKL